MKFVLEYIWIDAKGGLRGKTKIEEHGKAPQLHECGEWNVNLTVGSFVSEVILKPVSMIKDPFRGGSSQIVLCEVWSDDTAPHPSNTRWKALSIFNKDKRSKPNFDLNQEFFFSKNGKPISYEDNVKEGDCFCGIGSVYGRRCIEVVLKRCLWAELNVMGVNAEVAPSQWKLKICAGGIRAADELYFVRYILGRTAEEYGWQLDLRPKTLNWRSKCSVIFSTIEMRAPEGISHIHKAIEQLEKKHDLHAKWYGDEILTEQYDAFAAGASYKGSIRLPTKVIENQCGHFEDLRPPSNIDPYAVTSLLFATSCNIEQTFFV